MNQHLIIFDTETTGIPIWNIPSDDPSQPHLVQLAAGLFDMETRELVQSIDLIIRPDGWTITEDTTKIHGIKDQYAMEVGVKEELAVETLLQLSNGVNRVAHNITFDNRMIRIAIKRYYPDDEELLEYWKMKERYSCTMFESQKIMGGKRPKLSEAYKYFTGKDLVDAHSASPDMYACAEIYFAIQDHKKEK